MIWRRLAAFLVLAIGVPARATAREPVVSQVVVRGQAPARSASETRRDRTQLAATPHHSASDLLEHVPGLFVSQHGGKAKAHQIFFRGFDAMHGQDLELWVGGAPVNEVSHLHGQGYADLHFVMPEVVREVHAQPGPFDPRQGDFAVSGSVQLELGYAEPGFTASGGVGSFGTRRGFLAYRPADSSEATFAAAELEQTDGFGRGRASERALGLAQVELSLGGGYRARLLLSGYAGRFGAAGVLRLDDVERGTIDRLGSYDTRQGGRSARTQLVATLERVTPSSELVIAPYFVRRSTRLRSNYTGYLRDPLRGDGLEQHNDATTFGARASFARQLPIVSDADSVELGLSLRSDFVEQLQRGIADDDSVTRTDVDAEIRAFDLGAYVDLAVRPVRRVQLRGGVRADGLSFGVTERAPGGAARSAQGTHVGSKLTLEVGIVPGLHAFASYGEGFRSPQARSLADGERAPFTTVGAQELGLRLRDTRLSASLSAYRTTLSDDLVFDETTAQNVRAPASRRMGASLDLVARPNAWLTSGLGFGYTVAEFRESAGRYHAGEAVPFVPRAVLRLDLAFHRALGTLFERALSAEAGVAGSFVQHRLLPFGERAHDLMRVDARVAARLAALELSCDVYNLLDRENYDAEFVYASSFQRGGVASEVPARHVTAGTPRSLLAQLTVYL